jgi:hypothetical protein
MMLLGEMPDFLYSLVLITKLLHFKITDFCPPPPAGLELQIAEM